MEWALLAVVDRPEGVLVTFGERTRFLADGELFASRSILNFPSAGLLERLLAEAGFSAFGWYGDWEGGPFVETSSREIIVAARR